MNENIKIVNFDVSEWDRPARIRNGIKYPVSPYPRKWVKDRWTKLAMTLQAIRNHLGRSIKISSGYRDPAYNKAIGGKPKSQHMDGRAADILVSRMAMGDVHDIILEMYQKGELPYLGGLGWYPDHSPPFVHVDVRPRPGLGNGRLIRWTEKATSNRDGM